MSTPADRLRVAVAAPLSEENCAVIERLEPRIELMRDQAFYPPMRHPADFLGEPGFTRTLQQQQSFERLLDSADVLYGIPDVDPAALRRVADANPRLRWVHTMAAGGGAQIKAARLSRNQLERIVFTTSAGVHGGPLAEFAVFGVLAGAKDMPRLQSQQRQHLWSDRWEMRQVADMTVLVIGLGGIGERVATLLHALGARVIGCSKTGRSVEHIDRFVDASDLPNVVGDVDAIVSCLPGTDATHKLISAEVLSAVKPGVTLVNVGRGTVVDEDALVRALGDGRIGFAALDVFASEPLPASSPLWDDPGVLVSPHTAALSSREDRLIAELFADNATRLLDGKELRNKVDTVDFY